MLFCHSHWDREIALVINFPYFKNLFLLFSVILKYLLCLVLIRLQIRDDGNQDDFGLLDVQLPRDKPKEPR